MAQKRQFLAATATAVLALALLEARLCECGRYKEYTDNRRAAIVPQDVHPGYIVQTFEERNAHRYNAYRLLESEYSSYFSVLSNGQLMTVAKLTALVNKQIKLVVVEEMPNGNITHVLRLHVIGAGKMLRFSRAAYEGGTILENQPAYTRVIGLPDIYVVGEGLHPSSSAYPVLKHRIVQGNEDEAFVLKHVNTEISPNGSYVNSYKVLSKKTFDREQKSRYNLTIQVTDAKGLDKITAKVLVEVLDENDNSPVFRKPVYSFYVGNFRRYVRPSYRT